MLFAQIRSQILRICHPEIIKSCQYWIMGGRVIDILSNVLRSVQYLWNDLWDYVFGTKQQLEHGNTHFLKSYLIIHVLLNEKIWHTSVQMLAPLAQQPMTANSAPMIFHWFSFKHISKLQSVLVCQSICAKLRMHQIFSF